MRLLLRYAPEPVINSHPIPSKILTLCELFIHIYCLLLCLPPCLRDICHLALPPAPCYHSVSVDNNRDVWRIILHSLGIMDLSLTNSFTIPNFSHRAEQARHNDNSHPPSPRTSAEHNRPLSAHAHDNRSPTVGDAELAGSSSDSPHSISPPPDHPPDKTAESSSTDERGLDN